MNHWWRAYIDAKDHPKLLLLPNDTLRWQWFVLMCVAKQNGGVIPSLEVAAIGLRLSPSKAAVVVTSLHKAGLFDEVEGGYFRPHNWDGRQFVSDDDPTRNERQARYREKKRNALRNGQVTRDVTRTETETETEKEKKVIVAADAACDKNVSCETSPSAQVESPKQETKGYAFIGSVVRLTQRDFENWKTAYSRLDLRAELVARDAWLAELPPTDNRRTKWFPSTSQHLANRNAEAMARANPQKTRYPDPHDWRNAIA